MNIPSLEDVKTLLKHLDDFLDIMCDLEETPEELKRDKNEYIKLKHKASEETRIELYANLFIQYLNYININKQK